MLLEARLVVGVESCGGRRGQLGEERVPAGGNGCCMSGLLEEGTAFIRVASLL